ncbi:PAS domain-containing protein [Aureibacillus halotolerans]|uniref:PAS domain S-box-containing protein n=1 Tax=Aureibacillus halotolerans TaxID=1508390 RepID=A0A4R6UA72_9BACI|nr:PAS domain-containing protein [Aureibacillus halotolerans]TDQ42736.1 PAS domain S-box-containing protein [Aureibacillus halotolerans]
MYKQLFMQLREPAFIANEKFDIEFINNALAERLGYKVDELQGVSLKSLIAAWPQKNGSFQSVSTLVFKTKSRGHVTFELQTDPLILENGAGYFIRCFELFSNQTSTLLESRQFNELLKEALNHSHVGIVVTDPSLEDNPIVYMNKGFELLTGYNEKDVIGNNCRFLQGDKTSAFSVDKIRNAIENNTSVLVELLNYKKNGEPFWNELQIDPVYVKNQDRRLFVGVQKDITQRKGMEEELSLSLQKIKELSAPVVPVGNGISVLPLLGTIDRSRWSIIQEQVVEGVEENGEDYLIVDLSGLDVFEGELSEGFLKLAKMLSLMGTELVMTGVRPGMALTSIGMNEEIFQFRSFTNVKEALKSLAI